jgi:hypothetical protein
MKTLIWWAPSCSGGLCDRLLGMVTTYCIAKELGRRFLIKIDDFDMPSIVPINPEYDYRCNNCPYYNYIPHNFEQQQFFQNPRSVEAWQNIENVLTWSNQNLFYYFCLNRPEIDYRKRLLEGFAIVFTDILHLIPIDIPQVEDCIGIHIRTVDKQIGNCEQMIEQVPYIINVLEKCRDVIPSEQKIFITSDCELAYDLAKKIFTNCKVLYNPGRIVHSGTVREGEGMIKVFQDLITLSRCKKVFMGWDTNFSRVSALLNPERDFYVYEYPEKNEVVKCDIIEIANYFSNPYWR